jgi:hypothetical protein
MEGLRNTMDGSTQHRDESWTRACERYAQLAQSNPFFVPLSLVVQALADGPCAHVALARVDGVDLHLSHARPVEAFAVADAVNVQLRALTGGTLELRCLGRVPRTRTRVRVVTAEHAVAEVERWLQELGWVPETEWKEWR